MTKTIVGIHQPHYLPWLRYFDKIARSDVFIVLDNIQYNKNGWQNRNKIKSHAGAALLTVPVMAHIGDTLDAICINNSIPWAKKHQRTIAQAYAKAPYYADHVAFLEATYAQSWERLNELNRHMLAYYVQAMGIQTTLVYASELNVPGTATERLINLIKAVGGTHYYSGAYALDAYLDPDLLQQAHIELVLQQWAAPEYPQLYPPFIPDLSILDLLMNTGKNALAYILGDAHDRT